MQWRSAEHIRWAHWHYAERGPAASWQGCHHRARSFGEIGICGPRWIMNASRCTGQAGSGFQTAILYTEYTIEVQNRFSVLYLSLRWGWYAIRSPYNNSCHSKQQPFCQLFAMTRRLSFLVRKNDLRFVTVNSVKSGLVAKVIFAEWIYKFLGCLPSALVLIQIYLHS